MLNLHGFNIGWRPVGPHVVVDLDGMLPDEARERATALGVRVSLLTETSPGSSQAWVTLERGKSQLDEALEREAQRMLTGWFGGDIGATGARRIGRLPGYSNRKLQHRRPDGSYPIVGTRCVPTARPCQQTYDAAQARLHSRLSSSSSSAKTVSCAEVPDEWRDPVEVFDNGRSVVTLSGIEDLGAFWRGWHVQLFHKSDGTVDRSRTDARRAVAMLHAGVPAALVRAACAAGSGKVAEERALCGDKRADGLVESVMRGALREASA